jgi:phage terminase small subunit
MPARSVHSSGLTTKELMFCMEYLKNGQNATKAMITAGYKTTARGEKTNDVLNRPHIRRYLDIRLKSIEKKEIATMEWKLDKLVGITERTEDAKPQVAISAISELNKMQGHYSPTVVQQTNLNLDLDVLKLKQINDLVNDKQKDY